MKCHRAALEADPEAGASFDPLAQFHRRRIFSAPAVGCKGYRRAIAALHGRAMDKHDIDADLQRVAADFHDLLDSATRAELRAPTNGTRWTNQQLLFHMLFGFLVVRALLPLVKGLGRVPDAFSRLFAAALNAELECW
jgi:hypothetical protein